LQLRQKKSIKLYWNDKMYEHAPHIKILLLLNNICATSPERAISIEYISNYIKEDRESVLRHIDLLLKYGYVSKIIKNNSTFLFLTQTGLLAALSIYS